ncbi:alpha/beta hydrolase [Candidatus Bathyarchaeota archaeon]|nr:alpha/beta hydrolase [Candidatus Bathyarchaeota archaeon]
MRKWGFYLESDKNFLNCTLREPSINHDEAILYLHGWGGDMEVQSGLLDELCLSGFYVLNFNQRGFNTSTGKRSLTSWHLDASLLTNYLADHGLRVWICGLSTGGTMAISTMDINKRLAGGIIMSPFASLNQLFEDKPELRDRLHGIFGQFTESDYRAADAYSKVDNIPPRPMVFICGDADVTIPSSHSGLLSHKAGESATLVTVPWGDHILSTIPPTQLAKMIIDWIARVKFRENSNP